MKKYFTLLFIAINCGCFAQSNNILIRHDTMLLRASECEWIVKSLAKNNPSLTAEIGKSISFILLQAIEKGKLKAIDPITNKLIPAKEIFMWQMPRDSMMVFDSSGENTKVVVVQREISSDKITQIRIYQDWNFDLSTGKFECIIKWIELMEEIYTSSGLFLGMKPFCRIYY